MDDLFSAPYFQFARLLFERSLAFLYFVALLCTFNQFPALLGTHGFLPVPRFLKQVSFSHAPSIFHWWGYSDLKLKFLCLSGMLISLTLMAGISAYLPILVHLLLWLVLYLIYLSITNVGQDFYGFGWESMLLEAGFFMAFMGPQWVTPNWIPVIILRWMLFRTELGAGLIKLRGDSCWRDLTCLYYHHETQPMPNPLSRFFHRCPHWFHQAGVLFSHLVQLVVPFGIFLPQPIAAVCGGLIIIHQLILMVSGNYSWLNCLTIVLGLLCFPDFFSMSSDTVRVAWFEVVQLVLLVFALYLSYHPALNLLSKKQKMNYHWNRYHLIGAYGAFGSVTKKRYEIVLEGTTDTDISQTTIWKEYHFKGKPTSLTKYPPQIAPYHLRLDWMMWFLPFSVRVTPQGIHVWGYDAWFLQFLSKLFQNDPATLKLMKSSPFLNERPHYLRAWFYHYQFTERAEIKKDHTVWKREILGEYLPAVTLERLLGIID